MYVKTLKLRNFRNYKEAQISFSKGMNVITGRNAQGKTNLLESLVYLATARSFRTRDEKDLIRYGQEFADMRIQYEDGLKKKLRAIISVNGKTLMTEDQPVKKITSFYGLLKIVMFSPDDLWFFTASPASHRHLVDQEIAACSNKYLLYLSNFRKLLHDRNALLKNEQVNEDLLSVMDDQMVQLEVEIVQARRQFIQEMNKHLNDWYTKLYGLDMKVRMEYQSFIEEDRDLKTNIQKNHQKYRERDLRYRTTTTGIHHEDYAFLFDGKNMIHSASQGQKRMMMLAYKLTLVEYIKKTTGKVPILLLDDVLSELDEVRQKRLLNAIADGYQCILTTAVLPAGLKDRKFKNIHVEDGNIHVEGGINE